MRNAEWKKLVIHNVLARLSGAYKLPRLRGGYFSRSPAATFGEISLYGYPLSHLNPLVKASAARRSTRELLLLENFKTKRKEDDLKTGRDEIPAVLQRGFGRGESQLVACPFNARLRNSRAISRGRTSAECHGRMLAAHRAFLIRADGFNLLSRFLLSRACRKRRPASPVRKQARAVPLPPLEWSMAPVPITRTSGTAPA
jgi:hypothetical protein